MQAFFREGLQKLNAMDKEKAVEKSTAFSLSLLI
jgi:hypothetical protein